MCFRWHAKKTNIEIASAEKKEKEVSRRKSSPPFSALREREKNSRSSEQDCDFFSEFLAQVFVRKKKEKLKTIV